MVLQRDIDIIMKSPVAWEKFCNKTILVTGATGRLGMYIVETLAQADLNWNLNLRIVALARSQAKLQKVFGSTLELPNVQPLVQNITDPIDYTNGADYIFHTAGLASPVDFSSVPVDTLWGHVAGTRNVLEFARRKKNCQVFYVSTVEIYGEWKSDEGITEEDMGAMRCDNARACYPEAKRLSETMLASYMAQHQVPYRGVRLCHTFGPGISLDDGRAFAEFINDVVQGKDIVLQSDGSAMRTYTYVADAVGAILLIATKGEDGNFYNVANLDNLISIRDLAALIASLDPKGKVKVRYADNNTQKLKYLPFKLGIMNVDKVNKLGWKPEVDLKSAFRYTLEFYLQSQRL